MKIRNPEDFWSGVMFLAFGILAVYISLDYPMGTAMRMGPGYFPTYLGGMLIVIGVIVALISLKTESEPIKPFAWKPFIWLSVSFAIFGWGVDHIGFIPALTASVVLCALAGQVFKVKEVLIMTVVLVAGATAVFIYGIDLPYPLFWWR